MSDDSFFDPSAFAVLFFVLGSLNVVSGVNVRTNSWATRTKFNAIENAKSIFASLFRRNIFFRKYFPGALENDSSRNAMILRQTAFEIWLSILLYFLLDQKDY